MERRTLHSHNGDLVNLVFEANKLFEVRGDGTLQSPIRIRLKPEASQLSTQTFLFELWKMYGLDFADKIIRPVVGKTFGPGSGPVPDEDAEELKRPTCPMCDCPTSTVLGAGARGNADVVWVRCRDCGWDYTISSWEVGP